MEELDLRELLELFWSKKLTMFLIVLIAIVIGTIYTYNFVSPKYQSYTKILLSQVSDSQGTSSEGTSSEAISQTDITLNSKLISTYSEFIKSKRVLNEVISELGLQDSYESLVSNVGVSAESDTQVLKITVNHANAKTAMNIANKIVEVFSVEVQDAYNISNISVLDVAEEESEPYNINHVKDIVIFACGGVVISIIYVMLFNMLDNTVGSAKTIENDLGVVVLASIPEYKNNNINKSRKRGRRYEK